MTQDKLPPESNPEFRDNDDVHINTIHQRIVGRERSEPEEGFEKPPWWLWTFSVLVLFVMGFYLGKYSGSFGTIAHEVEQPALAAAGAVNLPVKGDQIFIGVCQTCHQSNGGGVAGQYPPLTGSEWVIRDPETPVRIVLYGLEGPITVKGASYVNKMPYFHDKLSDEEIAAVLTHVRSSWGNNAPAVTSDLVKKLRAVGGTRGPWSSAELTSLRSTR